MALQRIVISNIWGGMAPSQYFAQDSQYLSGVGIDPDLSISDSVGDRQTSGQLRPSAYSSFDGANVNANPYWVLTNPKNALIYAFLNNGRLISYTSTFGTETLVGTVTTSSGNGAVYYNNYLYLSQNADIARYGPLDGSPSLTNAVWTGATLGSQTALSNTTYPSIRGSGVIPNHAMHVHNDNKLYFCDYDSTTSTASTRGRGLIHWIRTTFSTTEGTGNDGSTYNALDLPHGFLPVDLESYGNDLVIAAIQTTNSTLQQGKAYLFFWDTISDSFYNAVELPDPLVTSLLSVNGRLHVFSGPISTGTDISNGYRISVYLGGKTVQQVYFSESGSPPLAGAVDSFGDRLVWGTFQQIPTTTASAPQYYGSVLALGSKDSRLASGVHGIINSQATGSAADGIVTAVKNVQQASFGSPRFVVGWRDASNFGLDNQGTTYGTAVWRSQMFKINQRFIIKRIRLNLGTAIAANHTITPTVFLDDFSSSSTTGLTVINNTNYTGSQRHVEYYPDIVGDHNFCLELRWTGTALLPVLLPITIDFEVIGE